MNAFVTGGAGFIGSNLVDKLLEKGYQVTIYDNFSTGRRKFVEHHMSNPNVTIIEGDVLNKDELHAAMKGSDIVFHFQANADVRGGINNTTIDLEQNIICTHHVLEGMRVHNIKRIAFPSSATVYGEPEQIPTPEDIPLIQTSLYGASKASAESIIQAYCEYYGIKSWIFRFVSFIGPRYTHGVISDFIKKLKKDPSELPILGDGTQRKSYLHVHDGIDAVLFAIEKANEKINIFNLGNTTYMNVVDLADIVCAELGLKEAKYSFAGGIRGWLGDTPFVHLDISKITLLGWKPTYTIKEGILDTISYLLNNEDILSLRD